MTDAAGTSPVVVFSSARCGWAVRTYAALIEKGVPFEIVDVKAVSNDRLQAWRQCSPYGRTPALSHGDIGVWESVFINEYIDSAFSGEALAPISSKDQALAKLWIHHCDQVLLPLVRCLANAADDERSALVQIVSDSILALEQPAFDQKRIAPFWNGRKIGLVDIAYQVLFTTLERGSAAWSGETVDVPVWFMNWSLAVGTAPSVIKAQALADDLLSRAN